MSPIRAGHQAAVGVLTEASAHLRTVDPSMPGRVLLSDAGWVALRRTEDKTGLRLSTVSAGTLAGLLDEIAQGDHVPGPALSLAADITREAAS